MHDRQPTYPGRVKLTPVEGQENVFDMVMAGEPTEEGTPPTKENLLTDDVAKLYKLSSDATPNDVLNILSKAAIIDGNQLESVAGVSFTFSRVVSGYYVGNGVDGRTISIGFPVKAVIIINKDIGSYGLTYISLVAIAVTGLNFNVSLSGNNIIVSKGANIKETNQPPSYAYYAFC